MEDIYESSSHCFRYEFIDMLLTEIKALNAEGEEEGVVYTDPETGKEKPLTPQVPDWTAHIDELHKLRAAMQLEQNHLMMESAK